MSILYTVMKITYSLKSLISEISVFVKERNWNQYHHPKNLVMCLSVEVSELMEHFIWVHSDESHTVMDDKKRALEITHELADVFNCIILVCNFYNLNTLELMQQKRPEIFSKKSLSPKNLIEHISVETGKLMENFLWVEEVKLKKHKVNEEITSKVTEVLQGLILLSNQLNVNLIIACREKLKVLRLKYPAHLVKDSVDDYRKRKKELKTAMLKDLS